MSGPNAERPGWAPRQLPGPLFALQRGSLYVVRRAIGLSEDPIVPCVDPGTAYQPVDAIIRKVHADLPTMTIGGVASLFLQLLHPQVVAGVADHSRYEQDPLGRLQATGRFLALTTYGTKEQAAEAITRVQHVHSFIIGRTEGDEPYDASSPELLEWVHLAEVLMFAAAYNRYGPTRLSPLEQDAYVGQMAKVAVDLGVPNAPVTLDEALSRLQAVRPKLRLSEAGIATRDFILTGPYRGPAARGYQTVVAAALDLLPTAIRTMLELPVSRTQGNPSAVQRRALRFSRVLRLATSAAHPANLPAK